MDVGVYDFFVYVNYLFDGDLSSICEVVFVQYGLQCNGNDYYIVGVDLFQVSGCNFDEVFLIVLNFFGMFDEGKGFDGMLVWLVDGWIGGFNVINVLYIDLSLFKVFDDLIGYVIDLVCVFNVKCVMVVGYLGGGQIVQCYVVFNNVDEVICKCGIDL